jgi:3-methyladenine DNA glycosylase Tag
MATQEQSGRALDLLRRQCHGCAAPGWHQEIAYRTQRSPQSFPSDQEIMRHFCVAIAYSQGARSAQITELIETPVFKSAFVNFDPGMLARRKPEEILKKYWAQLGYFRFKGKIHQIVQCARVLNGIARDHRSFARYLNNFQIPQRIRTAEQLGQFWSQFDLLQQDLQSRQMPFFKSTTSLLQLLLQLDFDAIKPDLIVMRLARRLGIVERETGDQAFRQCVRFVQEYSIKNSRRAAELDWALLAFGGQSGAGQSLTQRFCPASDPCDHPSCSVGLNHLCEVHL